MVPAPQRDELGHELATLDWPGWDNEGCLLDDLRSGSEAAYEALLERFQTPVYHLVQRLIDDSSDAGDVVQDVFLKVFRNVGSFRGQSSLKTWIYRIAVNEAHNRRRWFSRHRRAEVGLETDGDGRDYLDQISDSARSPYDLALNEEFKSAIADALAGLNPVFRTAVVLRDLEDFSYEEIADVLDVSLGTVKSRILRGREALRKALVERLEPETGISLAPQTVSD